VYAGILALLRTQSSGASKPLIRSGLTTVPCIRIVA
jgi:hypothetical protein